MRACARRPGKSSDGLPSRDAPRATRASSSAVPWWNLTRAPCRSGFASGSTSTMPSNRRVTAKASAIVSVSPRLTSATSAPPRLTATRRPASAAPTAAP
jgi:hypothetical protein